MAIPQLPSVAHRGDAYPAVPDDPFANPDDMRSTPRFAPPACASPASAAAAADSVLAGIGREVMASGTFPGGEQKMVVVRARHPLEIDKVG